MAWAKVIVSLTDPAEKGDVLVREGSRTDHVSEEPFSCHADSLQRAAARRNAGRSPRHASNVDSVTNHFPVSVFFRRFRWTSGSPDIAEDRVFDSSSRSALNFHIKGVAGLLGC